LYSKWIILYQKSSCFYSKIILLMYNVMDIFQFIEIIDLNLNFTELYTKKIIAYQHQMPLFGL